MNRSNLPSVLNSSSTRTWSGPAAVDRTSMPSFLAPSLDTGAINHKAKHLPGAARRTARTARLNAVFIPRLLFGVARSGARRSGGHAPSTYLDDIRPVPARLSTLFLTEHQVHDPTHRADENKASCKQQLH